MCEKSLVGSSRKAAIAEAIAGLAPGPPAPGAPADAAPVAAGRAAGAAPGPPVGANVAPRPGLPPIREPDRLRNPSTLSLKKSVRTILLDVMPPCECPTSQNALMFSLPTWSMMEVTMFCKYSSSAAAHARVGELGVAMTSRYLSL